MPQTHLNGIDIYYELHGSGPPLVMIMGLRRNAEWWYQQIPVLSRHFRLLVFDNRGSGRSGQPEMEYSIALFADDTAALMEHLNLESAAVLGYSMGGYIAQELAIRYPEKVQRLILVSTSAGGASAVRMDPARQKEFEDVAGLSPEQVLQKNLDIYFAPGFIAAHPDQIARFMTVSLRHAQPPEAFLRQYQACLRHDTTDRAGRIKAPVLIMTGDDDPLVPPGNSYILKELLPRAQLKVFPGGRHSFLIQMPQPFNQAVLEFLGAAPGA
ncbi:MAG: alpha/beta fold hydrolase [Desulfarculus sp.]|jgi:pimeloyl-ACP methyl ester carboxylesterase|nr:MAG: alpha/beta fold hydrolase [Desulfarculus sp.]